ESTRFGFQRVESRISQGLGESPYTPQDWGDYALQQQELNKAKTSLSRRLEQRPQVQGEQRELETKAKSSAVQITPATKFQSSPPPSSFTAPPASTPLPPSSSPTSLSPVSSSSSSSSASKPSNPGSTSPESVSTPASDTNKSSDEEPPSNSTKALPNLIDVGSDSEDSVSIVDKNSRLPCAPSTLADLLEIDFTIGVENTIGKPLGAAAESTNGLWDSFLLITAAPLPPKNDDLINLMDSQDYTHTPQNPRDLSELFNPKSRNNGKIQANNCVQDLLGDCNDDSISRTLCENDGESESYSDDDDDDDDDDYNNNGGDDSGDSDSDNCSDSYSDSDSEDDDGFNGLWYTSDSHGESKIFLDLSTLDVIKDELKNAGIEHDKNDLYNSL
ncbi:hypothetical protein BGX26_004085, partial [Mortierella sp. AD094]